MIKHPIFVLTNFPGLGGIETVTSAIVRELHDKYGMQIDIVSFIFNKGYEHLIPPGVTVHTLPNRGEYRDAENQRCIESIARDCKADVIVYQDSYAPSHISVVKTAQNLHLPLIVFEHNTPDYGLKNKHHTPILTGTSPYIKGLYGIANYGLNWLRVAKVYKYVFNRKRYLYDNCTKYVLLSEYFFPLIRRILGNRNPEKLLAIHNPAPKKLQDALPQKENIIFCAARLVAQKNISAMLRIWKNIQDNCPDWKFLIGGTGLLEERLKSEAKSMNLHNIEFLGYVDPVEYYRRAKIFWMTSLFEGFPMSLVEAQTYGCIPVVYNCCESVKDIITDGQNGCIVEFGNKKAFINATKGLISDDAKREAMSEAAIQNSQRFDLGKISEQWIELFSNL